MDLYIIRHAEARMLGEDGIEDDADRPLTKAGQAQCAPLAAALQRQSVHLDRIVTSPLLRARQTADGMLAELAEPKPGLHICEQLAPDGKRKKLTRFLNGLGSQSIAVVGHLPDLAVFAAWLIGSRHAQLDLAKAGVAYLHFADDIAKGAGALVWMVTPQWCS